MAPSRRLPHCRRIQVPFPCRNHNSPLRHFSQPPARSTWRTSTSLAAEATSRWRGSAREEAPPAFIPTWFPVRLRLLHRASPWLSWTCHLPDQCTLLLLLLLPSCCALLCVARELEERHVWEQISDVLGRIVTLVSRVHYYSLNSCKQLAMGYTVASQPGHGWMVVADSEIVTKSRVHLLLSKKIS